MNNMRNILVILFLVLGTGCASVEKGNIDNSDPYEGGNRKVYGFNDSLDRNIMQPIAKGYVKVTPEFFRTGVSNFFANLSYLNVILNSFLQGKFEQGFSDTGRFLFNSTLGIGGLFDVATPMGLEEHNEDLGQTFAEWGIDQGAYLNIPFMGPNTARNTPDYATSALTNPLTYIGSLVVLPVAVLNLINTRAELLEATDIVEDAALDKYSFTREAYLQDRKNLIYDGNPPADADDDFLNEDSGGSLSIE